MYSHRSATNPFLSLLVSSDLPRSVSGTLRKEGLMHIEGSKPARAIYPTHQPPRHDVGINPASMFIRERFDMSTFVSLKLLWIARWGAERFWGPINFAFLNVSMSSRTLVGLRRYGMNGIFWIWCVESAGVFCPSCNLSPFPCPGRKKL